MENFPSVRKNGFILLGNIKDSRLCHFYPKRELGKDIVNHIFIIFWVFPLILVLDVLTHIIFIKTPLLTQGTIKAAMKDFPVQLQTIHFVNPMAVFPMVGQALRAMLSKRLRERVTIHTGSNDEVLKSLAACSIPSACVPICMGGTLDTSSYIESFITGRLAIERCRQ